VPLDAADTGVGEIVSVKIYEPLDEPVPKPKRRPVTARSPSRRFGEAPVAQRKRAPR
jgi:hypothetical protein